jgi:hypothetical protein
MTSTGTSTEDRAAGVRDALEHLMAVADIVHDEVGDHEHSELACHSQSEAVDAVFEAATESRGDCPVVILGAIGQIVPELAVMEDPAERWDAMNVIIDLALHGLEHLSGFATEHPGDDDL